MRWILFIPLIFVFIFSPFKQGLFFDRDFYLIHIVIQLLFLIFMAYLLFKKETKLIYKLIPVYLLVTPHLLSLIVAESPKGAWQEVLRWFSYVSFFFMIYWLANNRIMRRNISMVFHLTGVTLGIYTILGFYDLVNPRFFMVAGRVGGTFQYPNTFAMVMAVFFFFALLMLVREKISNYLIALYSFPLVLYMLGFLYSGSRGMFVVFPLVWLVGLLLLNVKEQIEYLLYSLTSIGISFFLYLILSNKSSNGDLMFLFIFSLAIILHFLLVIYFKRVNNKFISERMGRFAGWYRLALPIVLIVLLFLGVLDLKFEGLLYQQLPDKLQGRVSDMSLSTGTFLERTFFFRDSLMASKDSLLFGFGGNAWRILYTKYQTLPYDGREVHNGYLDWIVSVGWVGFFIFSSVFIFLFYLLYKELRKGKDRLFTISVILGLLVIFLHSFLDFNFSYGFVWLMVFLLFGLGLSPTSQSIEESKKTKFEGKTSLLKYVSVGMITFFSIIIIVMSFRFNTAERLYSSSRNVKSVSIKKEILQKAVNYDPYDTKIGLSLAELKLREFGIKKDSSSREALENQIEVLRKTEPKNSRLLIDLALLYKKIGDEEKSVNLLEDALNVDHYNTRLYSELIQGQTMIALNKLKQGDKESAFANAKESVKVLDVSNNWYETFRNKAPKDKQEKFNGRNFTINDTSNYYAAVAYFILAEYDQVLTLTQEYKQIENNDLKEKVVALHLVTLERLGKNEELSVQLQLNEDKLKLEQHIDYFRKIL